MLLPSIVQNTPEVADDQVFTEVIGPFCVTPGCSCNLRKLSDLALAGRGLPGVGEDADAVPELVADEGQVAADPHNVESAKAALHSLSGYRCDCPLCRSGKQRRSFAEAGSHPHGEQARAQIPGCHGFGDAPSYADLIDYGSSQQFNGGARYDLFAVSPATGSFLVAPVCDKREEP